MQEEYKLESFPSSQYPNSVTYGVGDSEYKEYNADEVLKLENKISEHKDLLISPDEETILGEETGVVKETELKRGLKARQVAMLALGGTIGTGLFISTNGPLQEAGPVNTLIAYLFIGCLVFLVTQSLGEMATLIPVSSSFVVFTQRFCSTALGAAVGYTYAFSWLITLPLEISVVGSLIAFWTDVVPLAAWNIITLVCVVVVNFMPVKIYGEVEFWIALIKVVAIIGFLIFGLVMVCGGSKKQGPIGFRYWRNPGPWGPGIISSNKSEARFLGWVNALISAMFSMQGVETVGVQAGEAANPRKTVPSAIRKVFIRILLFYIGTLFFIGMIVPYNDPRYLDNSTYISSSPFLIAIEDCGIRVLPHIFNAVILTSVCSAANSDLYLASRTMYSLSKMNLLPKCFSKTTKNGIPIYGVALASLFGFLSYLQCGGASAQEAFNWLLDITAVSATFAWVFISISHIRFIKALKFQGISRDDLPFKALFMPYGAYIAAFFFLLIIFIQGFTAFCPWNTSNFFADYISVMLFGICWIGCQLYTMSEFTKTKYFFKVKFHYEPWLVRIQDIDLNSDRRDIDQEVWEEDEKPKNFFQKICDILS
ncbi:related to Arginine permease [Saccharomycodes ludwigii]|uniref:Related to Arginine permease n=1 Tax=Saccharomycodes ludwigii TaxID=36035 RepID=A0A376B1R4_9ASCO|nr:hypothetical protein SCDLUD_003895 [Saccharomycodes ludwigii]KAH3899615.1 hypothetical protein SCDLUD_003895 [Saccharomycodes ludwigii]SSD58414.1 related to Arginine permease [Saccharomycodes ludwigii]